MASVFRAFAAYRRPTPKIPPKQPATDLTPLVESARTKENSIQRTQFLVLIALLGAVLGPIFALLTGRILWIRLRRADELNQAGVRKTNRILDWMDGAASAVRELSVRLSADLPPKPVAVMPLPPRLPFDTSGIRKTLTGARNEIAALNTASLEIGHLAEGIRGISFKTNIVSLNASIEAAHVGDRGAGFGIVAAEVKNLAALAKESAEEIASRVASVQLQLARLAASIDTATEDLAAIPPEIPPQVITPIAAGRPSVAPEIAGKLATLADDLETFTGKPVPVTIRRPQPTRHPRRKIK
ncbi:MAG: methyl-accepting chemotaxis protein [Bryobacterales bacterium]|jgi:hypothetical protein|nr:methyl-accepting chemotaxis protein [Bryobacterales bacterium]